MFEVQDLKYATLATVSRCGMVWFSEDVLSTDMIFNNFLARLRSIPLDEGEDEAQRRRKGKEDEGEEAASPMLQVRGPGWAFARSGAGAGVPRASGSEEARRSLDVCVVGVVHSRFQGSQQSWLRKLKRAQENRKHAFGFLRELVKGVRFPSRQRRSTREQDF